MRGAEGEAGRIYFSVFNDLIRAPESGIAFKARSRRPPFDPAVGFLHRDRPGRPSLTLDLMEGLRPVLADRLALARSSTAGKSGGGISSSTTAVPCF